VSRNTILNFKGDGDFIKTKVGRARSRRLSLEIDAIALSVSPGRGRRIAGHSKMMSTPVGFVNFRESMPPNPQNCQGNFDHCNMLRIENLCDQILTAVKSAIVE